MAKIKKSKNPEGEINFRRDLYRWNIFAIVCIDEHSIDTSRGENQLWLPRLLIFAMTCKGEWFSPEFVSMESHRYESWRKSFTLTSHGENFIDTTHGETQDW